MKVLRGLGMLVVLVVMGAAVGQPMAHAQTTIKVMVPTGVKEELADLEARLPNLELIEAEPERIFEAVPECDAIIGLVYGQDAREILRRGKKLRWVHSTSAGVENIVHLPEMQNSDIVLTNAKIIQGPEIADHVFALLLTHTRNLKQFNQAMSDGWMQDRDDLRLPIIELRGKTMLIIGLGGIGTQVAQRAAAFGMRVLAVDPKDIPLRRDVEYVGKPDELNDLLPEADVVVSSVPHTPESEGMLGKEQFDLMKDGVYFINVSRGKIVQTDALVAALQSGKVRAAGLDVTDPEPLPNEHPLWEMGNVIITPHIATRSDQLWGRQVKLMQANIERFVTGQPLLHVVNQAAGF